MHKKIGKDRAYGYGEMLADEQTDGSAAQCGRSVIYNVLF